MTKNTSPLSEAYSHFLRGTCWYAHAHESNAPELAYLTLGLGGESGEFEDEVKKIVREAGFVDDKAFADQMAHTDHMVKLTGELGDVLWYLTRLADFMGLTLEDLMVLNTAKLFHRLKHIGKIPNDTPWPLTKAVHALHGTAFELFHTIKAREERGEKT